MTRQKCSRERGEVNRSKKKNGQERDRIALEHIERVYECQGCYRYFPKVSPIFDIDTGFKSIVDTDIDTLP